MKNLAGDRECDAIISEELEKAGIISFKLREIGRSEVPYTIYGTLGGQLLTEDENSFMEHYGFTENAAKKSTSFVFRRAWYYWIVEGYVPLFVAEEIYKNPNGRKDIRAGGHCGCLPPSEQLVRYKVCGMDVVNNYHIDTQEGLNYFVKTLKKHNLI